MTKRGAVTAIGIIAAAAWVASLTWSVTRGYDQDHQQFGPVTGDACLKDLQGTQICLYRDGDWSYNDGSSSSPKAKLKLADNQKGT